MAVFKTKVSAIICVGSLLFGLSHCFLVNRTLWKSDDGKTFVTCGSNTSQPFAKFKEAKGDIDAQLTSSSIDLEGLMQRGIIDSFDDTNWTISINFSPIANGTFSCSDDHRDSFDGVISPGPPLPSTSTPSTGSAGTGGLNPPNTGNEGLDPPNTGNEDDVGMRVGVGVGGSVVILVAIALFIMLVYYIAKRWYKGKKKGVASKKNNGSGKKDDDGRTKNRSTNDLSEMEKDGALSDGVGRSTGSSVPTATNGPRTTIPHTSASSPGSSSVRMKGPGSTNVNHNSTEGFGSSLRRRPTTVTKKDPELKQFGLPLRRRSIRSTSTKKDPELKQAVPETGDKLQRDTSVNDDDRHVPDVSTSTIADRPDIGSFCAVVEMPQTAPLILLSKEQQKNPNPTSNLVSDLDNTKRENLSSQLCDQDNPKPVPEPVLGDGARNMPAMKKSQWVTPSITKRNLDESNLIQKYMAGLTNDCEDKQIAVRADIQSYMDSKSTGGEEPSNPPKKPNTDKISTLSFVNVSIKFPGIELMSSPQFYMASTAFLHDLLLVLLVYKPVPCALLKSRDGDYVVVVKTSPWAGNLFFIKQNLIRIPL